MKRMIADPRPAKGLPLSRLHSSIKEGRALVYHLSSKYGDLADHLFQLIGRYRCSCGVCLFKLGRSRAWSECAPKVPAHRAEC
jgi:hypothetical protein